MNKEMSVDFAMGVCLRNGVKVYPLLKSKSVIHIESENNGVVTRYSKTLTNSKDVNKALVSTYIYLAKKIINKL